MNKVIVVFLLAFLVVPAWCADTGQLVSDWLRLQQRLIRNTKGIPHVTYSRHFAYTSVAVYESVVYGDPHYETLTGQLQELNVSPAPSRLLTYCWPASANAAFADMFRYFYKSFGRNAQLIDSLENSWQAAFLQQGFQEYEVARSAAYGKLTARTIIAWASQDGFNKTNPAFQPVAGEGKWTPTPPSFGEPALPYWSDNRTMVLNSTLHVTSGKPEVFCSEINSPFYTMVKEVYDATTHLTKEQKQIALFWDDSPDGKYVSVFGHWASILAQLIDEKKLSLMNAAEAFAKMSISQHDATIACWKGKYEHAVLRPVSYIQKYIDPNWKPVIETPLHPEFPAAHATQSLAAATALTEVFGNKVSFTDHTHDAIGLKARKFSSIEEAGREAGLSRLYGGIHYRPSIEEGYIIGQNTAEAVLKKLKFRN